MKLFTDISIVQKPGNTRKGYTTLYQFGRKDAFPGTDVIPNGSFTKDAGDHMSITNSIQNPQNFYRFGGSWYDTPPAGYSYYNLWSADNITTGWNDNAVVKTVYDPCPIGFKMPASNAFTRFASNGNNSPANADDTTDSQKYYAAYGHNFWTNNSKTATIFFPASGGRHYIYCTLFEGAGYYWSAVPYNIYDGRSLHLYWSTIKYQDNDSRSYTFAVRPVSE